MQGNGALLIVLPRNRADGRESLSQAFGADAKVRVILDRRFGERRTQTGGHDDERRRGERRRAAAAEAELAKGRWIAATNGTLQLDFLDPDHRAILFLFCEKHVIPCQQCQDTYRLGWILRGDDGSLTCPRCGNNLSAMAAAHAHACRYWANRLAPRDQPARPASR